MFSSPVADELGWCEIAQGLVWSYLVVDLLPIPQLRCQTSHGPSYFFDLIELFGVGTVSALYMAVELWAFWRQYKELDALLSAGGLELGVELATSINLHSSNRDRHSLQQSV
jgi:hypothetical protein